MKQKQFQKLKGGRMMSQLFLRTFMLLGLVLCGVNGAWAQTSYGKGVVSSAPTHATDWQNIAYKEDGFRAWYSGTSSSEFTLGGKQINDQWFVKLSDTGFIRIRVPKGAVVAGDILRVETIDIYQNGDQQNLGFKVEGSNSVVSLKETDNALHTLDYILKAGDIQSEDDSNDYIQINRNGNSGCGYHSVEILQPTHYTVSIDLSKFSEGLPSGCDAWFTIGDETTKYREAKTVAVGTTITYTMSSSTPHYTPAGWRTAPWADPDNGWMGWNASFTTTVRSAAVAEPANNTERVFGNINAQPEFTHHDGYVVTFSANNSDYGTVTATVDGNSISSGSLVASGKTVKFTATPKSRDYLVWGWSLAGKYGETVELAITEDVNVSHNFTSGIKINAYTNNANYGTVSIANDGKNATNFHVTPWPGDVTFTATPTANGQFVGWYSDVDCNTLVTSEPTLKYTNYNSELQTTGSINRWAKFIEIPRKTIGKPYCNHAPDHANGDNYFDITQLNPANGVTITANDGRDIKVPAAGGYMSFVFDNTYNLKDLVAWTISDNTELRARVNSVEFIGGDNGTTQLSNCYTDPGQRGSKYDKTAIGTDVTSKLEKVKEIRIHFKSGEEQTYHIKWICFSFEHADHSARPQLTEGTQEYMQIFTGEDLILANNAGFWRQYSDNTFANDKIVNTLIPTIEWKPKYVISASNLTQGQDYYFGVKDDMTCALGYNHHSDLVKVHVKVVEPIKIVDVNGTTRQYDVYAPDGISGTVGVVISLHGASNDWWNGRVDFNAIADNEKATDKRFVVVYPRGLMRQLRGTERGWETYTESNTEDVEFFKAAVKDIDGKNGLTVDYNRIYLAGFSNGGMMAYKAAHQAGDFFAAFASVGGYPVNESHLFHAGAQPTPFMHIQGKADAVFPSETYDVNTIVHNMIYRNGAQFTPAGSGQGAIAANTNVEEDCHQAEVGGAAYYMYKVANMGHTWTYDWTGDGKDDIAAAMWAFFNKDGISNNVDKTLKFRINAPGAFWDVASTGSTGGVNVGYIGFDNVNTGTSVLSYGGYTKTDDKTSTFNKDSNNKNLWHSLQFNGGINGAPHYLKLNVYTQKVETEDESQYFLVKLTKTGASTPVFAKRYQAGRGQKDLYINFSALPGFNEYKLEITKSSAELVVKVNDVEFHTGRCEDLGLDSEGHQITENPVFFYDVATVLEGMKPIYQPIYGKSYNGIAKEYLPIAEIPVGEIAVGASNRPSDIPDTDKEGNPYKYKVIEDNLKNSDAKDAPVMGPLPSTLITDWDGKTTAEISGNKLFNLAVSGKEDEDTGVKSNNAFILIPSTEKYTVDKVKGINISQHGRAEMPEYLNGTRGSFPTHGVIAIKLQGTLDFYLLAQNEITYSGTDPNPARRTLKVYYTNDQLDGELKELKEWWFYGTRSESSFSDKQGNSLAALYANIRLPQLGKDGTCTVFITYEGNGQGQSFTHASTDENKIWIKGFVIKRPDLKVTIGRTDNKYKDQKYNGENNTFCTRFGENKPYIWSFENVGFSNTKYANLEDKKLNEFDGRTYVCGGTDDSMDHLLLFSDPTVVRDVEGNLTNTDDKVQFDGRVPGQEHIEFLKASNYKMVDSNVNDRKIWDPIPSNGLKVNVTGSGWFKIKCSAPNGPVNMKVYSSTNYGTSYINLLREFKVDNNNHPASATGEDEHKWGEYTVYLKGHVNRKGNAGFWDGEYDHSYDEGAEEILRMSLYVVFDEIETYSYTEGHPQLNIHELSWLNEEPADYVFQREEDPDLLTEWQKIKRNNETVLWWKAGNDTDNGYTMLKENGQNAYNRLGQMTTNIADGKGVKSPGGYASTSVPSDAGTYDAYWDIAAPATTNAHTEKAYADGNQTLTADSPEYENASKSGKPNTEFDMPISGSFVRICAMQNTYVVAHVLPGASGHAVYVLDETGAQIPYSDGNEDDKKRLGYVVSTALTNVGADLNNGKTSQDGTVRIDFTVNAGKEYFICADGASISLARLEVHDWRYKPTKSSTKLELTGGANNRTNIEEQYDTKEYYRDAQLSGRTLTTGKWTSIVLPFSLNEKKFEEVFGTGAKCLHFTDVSIPNKTIYLTHHYYNMIVAGRPVFVRPGSGFDNSKLSNITDVTLQAREVINHTATNGFQFVASYDNATMNKNDLFMNDNNAIQYLNVESATYPGMRSYIKNNSGYDFNANVHNTKALFLNFDDEVEEATGIDELIAEEFGEDVIVVTKSTKVYDLNGRMVAEGKDINSLPAGIYIVNGKKYIVK